MKRTRLSRKTRLKAKTPLQRGDARLERTPMRKVNRKRRAKERARAYGPTERREWLKSLPCLICGRSPVDQAHVETGGMSRKADADKVVPLCSGLDGHHAEHHRGAETFEAKYDVSLQAEAERVEREWRERG